MKRILLNCNIVFKVELGEFTKHNLLLGVQNSTDMITQRNLISGKKEELGKSKSCVI